VKPDARPGRAPAAPSGSGATQRFTLGAAGAGRRLDVVLAGLLPQVSRTQLARHIGEGAVTLNDRPAAPSQKVKSGDVVVYVPPPVRAIELSPEPIPLRVVYEDAHLVVVDKPAGLVVHPAAGHEDGTLVNALLAHCHDLRGIGGELRPGIVHRIDKDTSGLLVVAKDDVTMNALGADFKIHRIRRLYEALVVGRPAHASGTIDTLHGRDPHDRKKFTIRVKTGKRAVTKWRVLERLGPAARLEAELETGRTHQVRVHFAAMGCPLLGDATYGRPPRDEAVRAIGKQLGRQALHARVLGFHHPATGAWLEFESAPPEDFMAALAALRELGG
jgi:23S rRNA pseudouridine1911/1915/1917 synthase